MCRTLCRNSPLVLDENMPWGCCFGATQLMMMGIEGTEEWKWLTFCRWGISPPSGMLGKRLHVCYPKEKKREREREIERERERERIGKKARIWIAHREMNWEITRKKGRNMRNYRDKKRDMNMEKSYGEQYGLVNGRSLRLSKGIGKYPELNQPTWWVFLESSVANFLLGVTPHVQGGTGIPKSIIPGWFLQKHRQVISHAKSDFQMFSFTTHSWNGPCHTFSPICVSWKSSFSTQKGRIWRI